MTPEQVCAAIAGHDLNTYKGWMAAAHALLADKPDWVAIVDKAAANYMVKFDGSVYALAAENDAGHIFSKEELYDTDDSAWSEQGCWDGSTPEACSALILDPIFVNLKHETQVDDVKAPRGTQG